MPRRVSDYRSEAIRIRVPKSVWHLCQQHRDRVRRMVKGSGTMAGDRGTRQVLAVLIEEELKRRAENLDT